MAIIILVKARFQRHVIDLQIKRKRKSNKTKREAQSHNDVLLPLSHCLTHCFIAAGNEMAIGYYHVHCWRLVIYILYLAELEDIHLYRV